MLIATHLVGFGSSASIAADGVDRLPTMTAATTSGVTISCTNESTFGFDSWKAGDNNNSTSFITNNSATAAVWKVDFGSGNAFVIQSYSIREIHPAEYLAVRYPASWTFEGSNNDSTWTVLDTKSGQTSVAANNRVVFPIVNQTAYRYYRFNVAATAELFGWAECELMT